MRKRLVAILIVVALISGFGGFFLGIRTMNSVEAKLLATFSEDVKEVRQGKLAGAVIAMSDNETLSEAWEEICSDVIRYIGEGKGENEQD